MQADVQHVHCEHHIGQPPYLLLTAVPWCTAYANPDNNRKVLAIEANARNLQELVDHTAILAAVATNYRRAQTLAKACSWQLCAILRSSWFRALVSGPRR